MSARLTRHFPLLPLALAAVLLWLPGRSPWAADSAPLHSRIDALLLEHLTTAPAGAAPEGVRVRRLYLDLTGAIPPVEETRAFLQDSSPDKWVKLVDRLLASEPFVDHMANRLDVMLMERRADKHVKRDEWEAFLKSAVRENQPFHQLAATILAADGRDEKQRAPAKFYLEREAEPNLLTRDIGRVFFGLDLQCAQCHDHPLITDYYQSDYYGLYSFVSRLSLFADKKKRFSYLAEKPTGEVKFTSVFTADEGRTNPRLPFGREIGEEPQFAPGEAYEVQPSKEDGGVPKYSRREQLAKAVAKGENPAFRRNIANRLWAQMMGRGLVHPLDLQHSDNPPSHPELLALLADEIAKMNFDMKAFLRQLALTDAYQRAYVLPDDWLDRAASPKLQTNHEQWQRQLDAAAEELEAAEIRHIDYLIEYSEARHAREVADEAVHKAVANVSAKKAAYEKAAAPLLKLNATRSTQQKTADLLQAALGAIDKSGVGDEAKPTVDVLNKKRSALLSSLAKTQPELAKLTKAAAPAKEAWVAAQAAVEPAREKVTPLAAVAKQAEAEVATAMDELRQWQRAHSQWQMKLEESAALIAAAEAVQAANAATVKYDSADRDFQLADQQRRPLEKQFEGLKAAAAKARSAAEQSAADLAGLKQAAETSARTQNLLGEALTAIQQAAAPEANETASLLAERQSKYAAAAREAAAAMPASAAKHQAALSDSKEAAAQLASVETKLRELSQRWETAEQSRRAALSEKAAAEGRVHERLAAVEAMWTKRFALTGLQGLTPEQLCWSILEATGQVRIQQAAALAALNKKQPLSEADQKDPSKVAAREAEAAAQARTKLQGNVKTFVKLFAAAAGEPQGEFFATADQALFFRNGSQIRGWIASGGDSLYQRLRNLSQPEQVAEEAYLATLSRLPDAEEKSAIVDYLKVDPQERDGALQEVIWALLTSIEFRFRH